MSAGVVVREATLDDARSLAEAHVRGWRWGYRELYPGSILDALSVDDRERQWTARLIGPAVDSFTFVAERAGRVVGLAFVGRSPDADALPGTAELHSLYVDEDIAGTGVGRRLMAAAAQRVAARGYEILTLWVDEGNLRARRFYEAAGLRPDGAAREEGHPLVPIVANEVRYRRMLDAESLATQRRPGRLSGR
jgi:GNAT superfamily N-acetyltransferase